MAPCISPSVLVSCSNFVSRRRTFVVHCLEFSAPGAFAGVAARLHARRKWIPFHPTLHRGRRASTQIFPSRVSTRNVRTATFAGPCVTLPERRSNRELCHGHTISQPCSAPSD